VAQVLCGPSCCSWQGSAEQAPDDAREHVSAPVRARPGLRHVVIARGAPAAPSRREVCRVARVLAAAGPPRAAARGGAAGRALAHARRRELPRQRRRAAAAGQVLQTRGA